MNLPARIDLTKRYRLATSIAMSTTLPVAVPVNEPFSPPSVTDVASRLSAIVAELLCDELSTIDVKRPLAAYGVDSFAVLAELEQWLGRELPRDLLKRCPTIASLALEIHRGGPAKSSIDVQPRFLRVLDDPWYRDLVNLQDGISRATQDFFAARGLRTLHLPITTGSISSPMGLGSDSKPVKIDLFGVDTYLADSMQFMLEYGCRLHARGSYYLMPSFRGEDADESHLCQFYHSEAEIPGGLDDVIELVEEYLRFMTAMLHFQCADALRGDQHIIRFLEIRGPLPRITLDEAVRRLGEDPSLVRKSELGFLTLTRRGERALIDQMGGFVWLTHPEHRSVPFYQAFAPDQPSKAVAADLLFGIGETVGAGERHIGYDEVTRALELHGVDATPYDWYVKMKKRYPMRTAGFGLGTARYLCWLLQHGDVRDCQLLPRVNGVDIVP